MENQETGSIEYGWTATEESLSSYFVVFLSILAFVLILSSALHKSKLSSILPEAGLTVIIGIIAGILIFFLSDASDSQEDQDDVIEEGKVLAKGLLSFNSKAFFVFLLPPIIFNSGYHINKEYFIRYFKSIALFACIGTTISTVVVAFVLQAAVKLSATGGFEPSMPELLTFGALISATDPVSTLAVFQEKCVDPQLFYLVFGESVLNDAVGLVLFNTLAKFVGQENTLYSSSKGALVFVIDFVISFLGSLFLGLLSGIVVAYVLKIADMRQTRILELSSYILVMYAPFFAAEVLPFSGIVTSLFTGIAAKQYAEPNLSPQTAKDADVIFRVISHLAETSLFLELGLSVFGLAFGNFHFRFVLFAILGCLLGRLLNIYPITYFFNASIKSTNIVRTRLPQECESNGNGHGENDNPIFSLQIADQQKIDWNTAHMLWFSGLRGAVAYACAKSFPNELGNRAPFVVTTMVIVLLTIFLLGSTTECALSVLKIEMNVDENKYMNGGNPDVENEESMVHKFERKFILPWVLHDDGNSDGTERIPVSTKLPHESDFEGEESTGEFEMRELNSFDTTSHSQTVNERKESIYDYGA